MSSGRQSRPPLHASPGTLTIVATPLGNPGDLSPRAAAALRQAELIVAEDTRSARRLLASLGGTRGAKAASPPQPIAGGAEGEGGGPHPSPSALIVSCFDANEAARAAEIADRIGGGADVVLISEAGTPLVSDPGYRVVAAAIAAGARIVPVPGPSALLAALVGAGLPTNRFVFLGFPPRKSGQRRKLFESVRALPFTLILYESPMRTAATLAALAAVFGAERAACVARELTKEHEEFARDTLAALAARYASARPLGEVTLVVAGAAGDAASDLDDAELIERATDLMAQGHSTRDAARELATLTGRPRRDVYQLIATQSRSRRA